MELVSGSGVGGSDGAVSNEDAVRGELRGRPTDWSLRQTDWSLRQTDRQTNRQTDTESDINR